MSKIAKKNIVTAGGSLLFSSGLYLAISGAAVKKIGLYSINSHAENITQQTYTSLKTSMKQKAESYDDKLPKIELASAFMAAQAQLLLEMTEEMWSNKAIPYKK
ncbi:MAG: hypothetical protein PF442_05940 [Desulfobulbaceae bacterium]|jgi:multisubunit Na+/H+ antiporter MnhC subunit|nr:hypothetical protein [Desulfobulbaceae bacterium]